MTAEQFAYWLQGFAELTDGEPTPEQWASIKEHLNLVFNKVTKVKPVELKLPEWPNGKSLGIMDGNWPFINPNQGGMCMQADGAKAGLLLC